MRDLAFFLVLDGCSSDAYERWVRVCRRGGALWWGAGEVVLERWCWRGGAGEVVLERWC